MNERVLEKLELPEVLADLARLCRFSAAAEIARSLEPASDLDTVRAAIDETAEAVELRTNHPDIGVGGARDIRDLVIRAGRGARLQPADLLLVQDTLRAARLLRRSFLRLPDVDSRFRRLAVIVEGITEVASLETDLERSIGPRGDVLDTASPELARIRRAVRVAHGRLMDRLNTLISGGRLGSALQDAIITMRDGRYVIPVRAEARSQVPGMVHDTSASGQTLFVEPFDVVDLNNRWREQQAAEFHEIERILDVLSGRVGEHADALSASVQALARFDLLLAKAQLSFDMRATRPRPWTGTGADPSGHVTHRISLINARHPLLDPATVVPISVEIGDHYRVLLITGPNTGGKTVALKTIGLLTLMAQCGLFIPADDQSVISVFPNVFVDIGDEQSIEQSLSTFSSHIRTIIRMLAEVDADSLVLLDELGAGTDPQEGSALARALISALLERGPMAVATTHYSEVKAYAYATPGVENASVEFDLNSLSPTYRLMVGVPGRSNALAIARRLGMPEAIIDEATALIDPDELRADALLQDIRARRDEADRAITRARETEEDARILRMRAARSLREAEEERRQARELALQQAESELAESRDTLRRLQRDRETLAATREHVEQRRLEVDASAERIRAFRRQRVKRPAAHPSDARQIRPGDRVLVRSLSEEGEVTAVSDGFADVQLGTLKVRQPLDGLERRGRFRPGSDEKKVTRPPLNDAVPMELDLRGHRSSEVPEMLETYIQSAYRSGLPFVRIIHGKGTGALREVVRQHLHRHPVVASHELAPPQEGGDGATVARIRE
ncbi:MAG TPA: endonuclease MutS2 [Thermomicrobiales bacterium]|nr:endonuclease MutS2 [Thermomicrobiales bacterium]